MEEAHEVHRLFDLELGQCGSGNHSENPILNYVVDGVASSVLLQAAMRKVNSDSRNSLRKVVMTRGLLSVDAIHQLSVSTSVSDMGACPWVFWPMARSSS